MEMLLIYNCIFKTKPTNSTDSRQRRKYELVVSWYRDDSQLSEETLSTSDAKRGQMLEAKANILAKKPIYSLNLCSRLEQITYSQLYYSPI